MESKLLFNSVFKESKYGWKLTREKYIPELTNSARECFANEREIRKYEKDCLKNYDLNMKFFSKLQSEEFNKELNNFLKNHKEFHQIEDLNETKKQSGYYIMVLDEYKQIYIGTSNSSIYDRIRRHMSSKQDYDRLLFGTVHTSRLSINSFRPLDTTRIYCYYTNETFINEDRYIDELSDKFILNRTIGGQLDNGLMDAAWNAKVRYL